MKKVFLASMVPFLFIGSVIANEPIDNSEEMFAKYTEIQDSIRYSGWDYLGCASSSLGCQQKAKSRGYAESKLVYSLCTPRSTNLFSCFAK